ncbi:MinD/ParA family protein [Evansella sp. AB-rgal1]|uniref:MinD/ParA family protein n=1 Tax=Evansella sp. AB-rgal1 TaxID=3242696 RepID=UPI00359DE753
MKDQADVLRNKMKQIQDRSNQEDKETKVIAIVSGKGGVGKTNFTVNFAIALQELKKNVLIFDLDIGMGNIDILLGRSTTYSVVDMLEKDIPIQDIMGSSETGITFISGGTGFTDIFEMDESKMNFFLAQLSVLEEKYDYILFDMGAGISNNSLQFLLSVNEIILITTPEPTSVTDAYATIKYIHAQDSTIPIYFLVNRVRTKQDGEVTMKNIRNVCSQFLQKEVTHLGNVPDDEVVWKAVRSQQPFLLSHPNSKPSIAIKETALLYMRGVSKDESSKGTLTNFVWKLRDFFQVKAGGQK